MSTPRDEPITDRQTPSGNLRACKTCVVVGRRIAGKQYFCDACRTIHYLADRAVRRPVPLRHVPRAGRGLERLLIMIGFQLVFAGVGGWLGWTLVTGKM